MEEIIEATIHGMLERLKVFPTFNVNEPRLRALGETALDLTSHLPGDIAEVGVFRGSSAKMIAGCANGRTMHLFDTFTGFSDEMMHGKDLPRIRHCCAPSDECPDMEREVRQYLNDRSNVKFYVGVFPETAEPIEDKKFCMVHLDCDVYKSYVACFNFFWPRLVPGGMIIMHDYGTPGCPGATEAAGRFFIWGGMGQTITVDIRGGSVRKRDGD